MPIKGVPAWKYMFIRTGNFDNSFVAVEQRQRGRNFRRAAESQCVEISRDIRKVCRPRGIMPPQNCRDQTKAILEKPDGGDDTSSLWKPRDVVAGNGEHDSKVRDRKSGEQQAVAISDVSFVGPVKLFPVEAQHSCENHNAA